ncbi:MAG: hypothetical protein RIE14_10190 [Salinisphaeraceae bacterium]
MAYAVRGYTGDGTIEKRRVEARSGEEARARSGFSERRIVSVGTAHFDGLLDEFTRVRLSVDDQAMMLAQLGAAIVSGQSSERTFRELMRGNRHLRKQEAKIAGEMLVSKRLAMLNFDPQAVLLAEVGESSNTLGTSLQHASEEMLMRRDLLSEVSKGLLPGIFLMLMGIGLLCGVSVLMAPELERFAEMPGLDAPFNAATQVMFVIDDVLRNAWWLILGIIAAIYALRRKIWERIRSLPAVNSFAEYFRLLKGMRFLTAFKPLFEAGINTRRILEQLGTASRGREAWVYQDMLRGVNEGKALSVLLDRDEWPTILRQGFKNFERADPEVQKDIIGTQTRLMKTRTQIKAGWMRRILYGLGLVTGAGAILLMVFGGYFVFMNATPA